MSNVVRHPFHLVDESPWPIVAASGGLMLTCGLLSWFHQGNPLLFMSALASTLFVMVQWWRDVSRESSLQGLHSSIVELGMRWGMVLFITSEVMFFVSFFWAFFHSSLSPTLELGGVWPPAGIVCFNPFQVPLLNTVVLLASGVSVTWAHHSLSQAEHAQAANGLFVTMGLGVYFTLLQGMEYYEASFTFADSAYGSTFFLATGFHGLHVLVGTVFLSVCYLRHLSSQFSASHHFGLEAAAWYWHFVDVVWLFLYISIYWWGGA